MITWIRNLRIRRTMFYRTILPDYALEGHGQVRDDFTHLVIGYRGGYGLQDHVLQEQWESFVASVKPVEGGMWLADQFANLDGDGDEEWVMEQFFGWLEAHGYKICPAWDPTWVVPINDDETED